MLFCRSGSVAVLFSLLGLVWSTPTPGRGLQGRTMEASPILNTVQPSNDYPVWTARSMTDVGAGTQIDDSPIETNTEQMVPPERNTTSVLPSEDHPTNVLDFENNTFVAVDDEESETSDAETSETLTTAFFRTEDEFRTRRGIVLVDDDFNVSPADTRNDGDGKRPKTTTTDEGSGQEEPPSSTPDHTSMEGSGGDDEATEQWHYCLNSTCHSRDMSVFPGHDETVPVGTNLSLSCVQSNESIVALRWYKYDDAGNPLLQADVDRELELTHSILKSRMEDSGRYVCVRAAPGSCCHRTLHVKVYEVPNYKYHLIVVGVVAAVSLFACLLLGVCRNYKTKKYEVQLELQNIESDCVYKM